MNRTVCLWLIAVTLVAACKVRKESDSTEKAQPANNSNSLVERLSYGGALEFKSKNIRGNLAEAQECIFSFSSDRENAVRAIGLRLGSKNANEKKNDLYSDLYIVQADKPEHPLQDGFVYTSSDEQAKREVSTKAGQFQVVGTEGRTKFENKINLSKDGKNIDSLTFDTIVDGKPKTSFQCNGPFEISVLTEPDLSEATEVNTGE